VTITGADRLPGYEHEVKAWVAELGVPVPRGVTVATPAEVATAAAGLRPPLVVKAFWPGLVHKSDVGAVRLGNPSAAAACVAAARMADELRDHSPAGYLVEEQAAAGIELVVGAVADPTFGATILLGLGGIWAEALDDTVLRLAPITERDAAELIDGLRGRQLLAGGRGRPAIDRTALIRLLLAVGGADGIAMALGDRLGEFELNPVIATADGVIAVDARLIESAGAAAIRPSIPDTDFGRLFAPSGVAVVGASTRAPNFGNMFLQYYREAGLGSRLLAVHPSAPSIDGVPAVPSLADTPPTVEYALVAVPAAGCAEVVVAARPGTFVQVMSGGFAETGADGARLETELVAAAGKAGVRLLGPNCMGVYSPRGGQTFLGGEIGRPGRVAVLTQSGGVAGELITVGERRGLTFSKMATLGNSADVTAAELVRYLADDPETAALGLYLENPRDGRGLFEALCAVRGRLPIAALVGGRSRQGARAAVSHTGALVSDDRIWRALADQTGIALVTSQDALLGALDFVDQHLGRRVAVSPDVLVLGPSGGAGVLAADCFDAAELRLAPVPETVHGELRALGLGAGTSLGNPLEITVGPRARPDLVYDVVSRIDGARRYPDVVAHANVQSFVTFGTSLKPLLAYIGAVADLQRASPYRVTLVLRNTECAPSVEAEARAVARAAGVPLFRTFEAAASAIAAGKRVLGG
jgi:acyl-CoA synthetase (NDP forming)